MTTLVYSPAVTIVIDTINDGLIDISEDIVSGSVTLRENASHTFDVSFNNTYRKYDGIFTPNDRVVIQLKRLKWLQVFAGYLDQVPMYSTFPRVVELSGQCTLKIMKNWPWDARSQAASNLIHTSSMKERDQQDGGVGFVAAKIMTEVVGWSADKIHIGKVPDQWFSKFQSVFKAVSDDALDAAEVIGTSPIIAGRTASASPTLDPRDDTPVGDSSDMSIVLLTIRTLESGNNYTAVNRGDGVGDIASGAYQFVTTTWNNYGGYKEAYLAPRAVQDAKATEYANYILGRWGNKLVNIPYGWYLPKVFTHPELLDKIPAENEGNQLTIRQYGEKWVKTYYSIYEQVMGKPPANPSPTGPITVVSPTSGTSVVLNPADQNQSRSSSDAIYPIPNGVSGLDYQRVAWGGHTNGKIPPSAMKYAKGIGWGHPSAVDSMTLLIEAGKKDGYDFTGSCYRSYENQAIGAAQNPNDYATPGRSNHGWGLAMDFTCLTGMSKSNPGKNRSEMFDTQEYKWLLANAWRWGWGHPAYAQRGGSGPVEPWHWEFFAFENFRNSPEARPGVGYNPSSQGPNPFDGDGLMGTMAQDETSQLFSNIAFWSFGNDESYDEESAYLSGIRATMNDTPVMETVGQLIKTANRSYCAAPNGDFIAWFPDYWGEYNTAGRMNVELIELMDFSVTWNDSPLVTHQFVEGSGSLGSHGLNPDGIRNAISANITAGVATVELPRFLESIVNYGGEQYPWLSDPDALLRRFGARVDRTFVGTIFGPQQEFWFATHLFLQSWADMFRAHVPLTFMPELFPGMLLCIPELKVQFYVKSVTHSWNMTNDVGFTTSAETCAPSATDGSGFFLFPKGGKAPVRTTGSRNLFRS